MLEGWIKRNFTAHKAFFSVRQLLHNFPCSIQESELVMPNKSFFNWYPKLSRHKSGQGIQMEGSLVLCSTRRAVSFLAILQPSHLGEKHSPTQSIDHSHAKPVIFALKVTLFTYNDGTPSKRDTSDPFLFSNCKNLMPTDRVNITLS